MSPRVESLLESMALLRAVIDEENALLDRRDFAGVKELTDRKTALVRRYEDSSREFRLDAEAREALDPDERALLIEASTAFDAAAADNAIRLNAHMTVTQHVVDAIVSSITHAKQRESGYGAVRGSTGKGGYKPSGVVSAAYDKKL